jgi:hypothetical protein
LEELKLEHAPALHASVTRHCTIIICQVIKDETVLHDLLARLPVSRADTKNDDDDDDEDGNALNVSGKTAGARSSPRPTLQLSKGVPSGFSSDTFSQHQHQHHCSQRGYNPKLVEIIREMLSVDPVRGWALCSWLCAELCVGQLERACVNYIVSLLV